MSQLTDCQAVNDLTIMSDNATGLLMVKPFYNRNTNKQTDLKMTINLRENNSSPTYDSDVNNNQYKY